jgi:diguanylate cyclase (GGDEF)-like protein
MIDLDGFKEINDRRGHQAGDKLLAAVAKQIQAVAGKRAVVARLGGDEFAVLQRGISSPEKARQCAVSLIGSIETAAFHDEPAPLRAGASVGYAVFPQDADTTETLLRNADLALYEAKRKEPGSARSFSIAMIREMELRRRLEDDLRAALTQGGLGLYLAYQPQVRLSDNELVGFEALVRWNHPELGELSPEIFVPIAERAHLIGRLGDWVLREACSAARLWDEKLYVAVNLSPAQITEGDLPHHLHSLLLEAGLSPSRLELEVTENVLIEDKLRALHVLRRLSSMGIRIVMDDFGTGYASLSYLHIFPFDKIKIDRSFITNLEINAYSVAIVDAVLGLCNSIGIPATAEGIETQAQLEMLMSRKCDFGQGFYLGCPTERAGLFPSGSKSVSTSNAAVR